MIIVDDVPILANIPDILRLLQTELRMSGSNLLHDINYKTANTGSIMLTCPYHSGGVEKKPSMGMTTREIKKKDRVIPIGYCHCFSCHEKVTLEKFISHCFGLNDGGAFGARWLIDRFTSDVDNRACFFTPIKQESTEKKQEYISEDELAKYSFIHPYMKERYLEYQQIVDYDVGYDKLTDCITFPVHDTKGRSLFIVKRSVRGKRFYIPDGVDKPLYGLYQVLKNFSKSVELYVCESILNALMLVKWGKPAVALLGTGSDYQINMLRELDYRRIILCLDNDTAGEMASNKLCRKLDRNKFISKLTIKEKGKDINDYGYLETFDDFMNYCKEERGI